MSTRTSGGAKFATLLACATVLATGQQWSAHADTDALSAASDSIGSEMSNYFMQDVHDDFDAVATGILENDPLANGFLEEAATSSPSTGLLGFLVQDFHDDFDAIATGFGENSTYIMDGIGIGSFVCTLIEVAVPC